MPDGRPFRTGLLLACAVLVVLSGLSMTAAGAGGATAGGAGAGLVTDGSPPTRDQRMSTPTSSNRSSPREPAAGWRTRRE